jgi:hypothetical protein
VIKSSPKHQNTRVAYGGADFETAVHELKAYFGFFRLHHTSETILRFYSYDGATNYVRCRTGGPQGDCPEFMVFCLVTLHLWGRTFGKFPEIKDLEMQTSFLTSTRQRFSTRISTRMLEQLALRTPKTFHATSEQDLNPRPFTVNDHPSVLQHEMMVIDPDEKPTHMLTWKTTVLLSHIQPRSHDDRFPIPLWETWFCQSLGVPIPALLENSRQCPCRQFSFDHYVITFRRVSVYLQHCQRTSGSYIGSVCYYARLVTELRPIKELLLLTMNGVTSRSRIMSSCHSEKMIGSLLVHS